MKTTIQLVAATVLGLFLSPETKAQEETDPFKIRGNFSQKDTTQKKEITLTPPFIIDDEPPEYPGGTVAMWNFFKENSVYPSDSVEGKVVLSFIVDTTGKVQNIKVRKSLSPLADAEVIRMVQLINFIPAKRNGKPVPAAMLLPFTFTLDRKN
ncbi:energy transducer TonB [Fluviicola sp.]|jgi:TonB family protein|uniref:energy transducer TonB n=1 Tax=Fluviicola sp. TaxID=1917219 RepID=UPI0028285ACF|nr:energy transducer TonB [Fluviicola sp.]MDR0801667.1 energy transducer TonB [Fluviicola sp.]